MDAKGNIYGTTTTGGTYDFGVLFKISRSGRENILHTFGTPGDGLGPSCRPLLDAAGNLYGTTDGGGAIGFGTIFKLARDGTYSILHSFAGKPDGYGPVSDLVADAAGNLYGTTQYGGTSNNCGDTGCGAVFKLTPAGQETILYSFRGGSSDASYLPSGVSLDGAGNLYGITYLGGLYRQGELYRIAPNGTKTTLYDFFDGRPFGGLVFDPAGNIYGTTIDGGVQGTVWKFSTDGVYTVLHAFTGLAHPQVTLILDASGNLYGTTVEDGAFDAGTVYQLTPDGTYTVLHTFMGGADGAIPYSPLYRDGKGNLFGTTYYGGGIYGSVFEVQH